MPYGITRPQWINSLWLSDTIWWHRSGPTLAQIMASCLMTPSHHLNLCWLIISEVVWHSREPNYPLEKCTRYQFLEWVKFVKLLPHLSRDNELSNILEMMCRTFTWKVSKQQYLLSVCTPEFPWCPHSDMWCCLIGPKPPVSYIVICKWWDLTQGNHGAL